MKLKKGNKNHRSKEQKSSLYNCIILKFFTKQEFFDHHSSVVSEAKLIKD